MTKRECEDDPGMTEHVCTNQSCPDEPTKTKAVQRWADVAMFRSEDLDARTGPTATVLQMNSDPLGSIAAATLMYKGIVIRDLAEVTDEQRRECWQQITDTKLKTPFEFVEVHILLEGVTRSLTHQGVRQRTAKFTQESLRFAVVEDNFSDRVALPPSLRGTTTYEEWFQAAQDALKGDRIAAPDDEAHAYVDRHASLADKARFQWDAAVQTVQISYAQLVNNGIPAEDARGLLPHNITTRYHWGTDLRALQDQAGNRLCTQAQFEWRAVWIRIVEALRQYPYTNGVPHVYNVYVDDQHHGRYRAARQSSWQFDLIADSFRPACYLTGKCEFAAQDLDRKCSIRSRVDDNASLGRRSDQWHLPLTMADSGLGHLPDADRVVHVDAIDPREWLADPGAAR